MENKEKINKEIEKVSGGAVYKRKNPFSFMKYQVIDDSNGRVLATYSTLEEAQKWAREKWWQSDTQIGYFARKELEANGKKQNESKK